MKYDTKVVTGHWHDDVTRSLDLGFLKPNPECDMCDMVDNYVCFFCEVDQVQDQTTARLTDCCTWVET